MRLLILTSHPIQYQAPLWRELAKHVELEVLFLTDQGQKNQFDKGFQTSFSWDQDLLSGYQHDFLNVAQPWRMDRFWGVRLRENIKLRLKALQPAAVWVEGWRFFAHWQVLVACFQLNIPVYMRGETNDILVRNGLKSIVRSRILRYLFGRISSFLYIGSANRRFYESMGVPQTKLFSAPYYTDTQFFSKQATRVRQHRNEIRQRWKIPRDAFCLLFYG
jgi:hypothetical protein